MLLFQSHFGFAKKRPSEGGLSLNVVVNSDYPAEKAKRPFLALR